MRARGGSPGARAAAVAVLAAVLAAPPALATTPAPAATPAKAPAGAKAPTVEEVLARHAEARGGLRKLRSLKTLRQVGRVSAGAHRQGLVTREIKRGGRIRFEFTVQGVTAVFASDGRKGWKVSPFEGEMGPQSLPEDVVAEAAEQGDIDGPLVDWKKEGHRVELSGSEPVGGREAYRLEVSLKSGGTLTAWVDAESYDLVRTEAVRQARGRPVRVTTTFGDFRRTGGISFPHLVEVRAAGRPQVLRVVVDEVEVNPPLADSRFEPPR